MSYPEAMQKMISGLTLQAMRAENQAARDLIIKMGRDYDWTGSVLEVVSDYGIAAGKINIAVHAREVGNIPPLPGPRRFYTVTPEAVEQAFAQQEPSATPAAPLLPDCTTCGHNTAGVVGGIEKGRCTAFVPYPPESGQQAGYCNCRCVDDPAVKSWLAAKPKPVP